MTQSLKTADSPSARMIRRFAAHRSVWIGGVLVGFFVVAATGADLLAPYSLSTRSTGEIAAPPTAEHWLGTDTLGKDVLSRVIYGGRLSLLAGGVSVALAVAIGAPWGLLAGYFGGVVDSLLMRTIDVALAFPAILMALLLAAAWGAGWGTVVVAVGLINVPPFARQVRATVLTVAELEYVLASRAMGANAGHILSRVLLPSLVSPVVVLATLTLGMAILEVAGLSFLGLGGELTDAEWGTMLAQARTYWGKNPWMAVAPGLAISLTVLGFNLLGDGLRDALDPRSEMTNL